jgi:hypothetical protein
VFVLGDIRQAGADYADRFLEAITGFSGPVIVEIFAPASRRFLRRLAQALPNFTLEVSLESHDEAVRRAFGKPYGNEPMERTIADALDVGARRLDVFFMVGLPFQTTASVLETVEYCGSLLRRFDGDGRLVPFISPLAPFLDPGSRAFEEPFRHGYHLFARTLSQHRERLTAPSWKYVLNYETRWLSRDDLVSVTYAAGRRMNQLKAEHGLVPAELAAATDRRIERAVELMAEIDRIVAGADSPDRHRELTRLKPHVDQVNMSTVCDKRELTLRVDGPKLRYASLAHMLAADVTRAVGRRLRAGPRRTGAACPPGEPAAPG